MKKICLVARQNIYKDSTHLHDDNGLRALNGIKYGKVHEIEDNEDPLNIWNSRRRIRLSMRIGILFVLKMVMKSSVVTE